MSCGVELEAAVFGVSCGSAECVSLPSISLHALFRGSVHSKKSLRNDSLPNFQSRDIRSDLHDLTSDVSAEDIWVILKS